MDVITTNPNVKNLSGGTVTVTDTQGNVISTSGGSSSSSKSSSSGGGGSSSQNLPPNYVYVPQLDKWVDYEHNKIVTDAFGNVKVVPRDNALPVSKGSVASPTQQKIYGSIEEAQKGEEGKFLPQEIAAMTPAGQWSQAFGIAYQKKFEALAGQESAPIGEKFIPVAYAYPKEQSLWGSKTSMSGPDTQSLMAEQYSMSEQYRGIAEWTMIEASKQPGWTLTYDVAGGLTREEAFRKALIAKLPELATNLLLLGGGATGSLGELPGARTTLTQAQEVGGQVFVKRLPGGNIEIFGSKLTAESVIFPESARITSFIRATGLTAPVKESTYYQLVGGKSTGLSVNDLGISTLYGTSVSIIKKDSGVTYSAGRVLSDNYPGFYEAWLVPKTLITESGKQIYTTKISGITEGIGSRGTVFGEVAIIPVGTKETVTSFGAGSKSFTTAPTILTQQEVTQISQKVVSGITPVSAVQMPSLIQTQRTTMPMPIVSSKTYTSTLTGQKSMTSLASADIVKSLQKKETLSITAAKIDVKATTMTGTMPSTITMPKTSTITTPSSPTQPSTPPTTPPIVITLPHIKPVSLPPLIPIGVGGGQGSMIWGRKKSKKIKMSFGYMPSFKSAVLGIKTRAKMSGRRTYSPFATRPISIGKSLLLGGKKGRIKW